MRKKIFPKNTRSYKNGYQNGYHAGWQHGMEAYSRQVQGTSIIIRASGEAEKLKRCLQSIMAHTPESHEIIILDDGSVKRVRKVTKSFGDKVSVIRTEPMEAYAVGVNQGLRWARGAYILLLDDGAEAADGWLSHLLAYYESTEDTDRGLPAWNGINMLMSRHVFQKLGYWDEALDHETLAADEYVLRARLLGQRLMTLGDVPSGASGDGSLQLPVPLTGHEAEANLDYYANKWGNTSELMEHLQALKEKPSAVNDFYPTHVIVRGCGETLYWLEDGSRHPIENGEDGLNSVRVSQIELKNWTLGPALAKEDVLRKISTLSSVPSPYGSLAEGILVRDGSGGLYQSMKGKLRRLIGKQTLEMWQLNGRPVYAVSDDVWNQYSAGIPIAASPVILSSNL